MAQPGSVAAQLGAPWQCRGTAAGSSQPSGHRPCVSRLGTAVGRSLQPLSQPRALAAAPSRTRRGRVAVIRADATESGIEGYSLPLPERKVLTRKAKRRIVREGPMEQDLRDESGRIVKEVLPGAFGELQSQLHVLHSAHPQSLPRPRGGSAMRVRAARMRCLSLATALWIRCGGWDARHLRHRPASGSQRWPRSRNVAARPLTSAYRGGRASSQMRRTSARPPGEAPPESPLASLSAPCATAPQRTCRRAPPPLSPLRPGAPSANPVAEAPPPTSAPLAPLPLPADLDRQGPNLVASPRRLGVVPGQARLHHVQGARAALSPSSARPCLFPRCAAEAAAAARSRP